MSTTPKRRTPQQGRAERRVEAILKAAADRIVEVGYDAATMTEIAERSGTSIGAIYQYFPNKAAVGLALRAQYANEMEQRWSGFDMGPSSLTVDQLVDRLLDLMIDFMEERPAYLILLGVPLAYKRDAIARNRLRQRFAEVFRARNPHLSSGAALQIAVVTFQIIKGLSALYADAGPAERKALTQEFRAVLKAYLATRL